VLILSLPKKDTLRKKLFYGAKNVDAEQKKDDVLKDKIKSDSVIALKNRDQRLVDTLRFVISLIDKKELQMEVGKMTTDDEIAVLRKELKNKQESMEMFAKAGRNDLVDQLKYEIEIVAAYLPKELSEEEIVKMVEEVVAKVGTMNFGMVMGQVMKMTGGRASGDLVSKIVREKLAN